MDAHPPIVVLGYSEAAMWLRRRPAPTVEALISIHGQREHPIEVAGIRHRLDLRFDDVESPDGADLMQVAIHRARLREAEQMGLTPTPPTPADARRIIDFARSIREMNGTLLCQCLAGISRYPAAALLCLAAWTSNGQEDACVAELLSIRPSAQPHRDLVRFGDEYLNRHGRLLAARDRVEE